jgi:membrane-associated PAP2 superfamily phosphatase
MVAVVDRAAQPGKSAPAPRPGTLHLTLAALVLLLAWDLLALDRAAMHLVGSAQGFGWRDHVLTSGLLHGGGRVLGWAVLALLVVNVWRPLWPGPSRGERVRWLAVTLLCALLVPALKQLSPTSCPWDLAEFGGQARYLPHWQALWSGLRDGGPGGCFPSGHASAAFAFVGGWFVLRPHHPRSARRWLGAVLLAGLLFGGGQTLRGAHFPSHTLWTAWLCWALSAALLARRTPVGAGRRDAGR